MCTGQNACYVRPQSGISRAVFYHSFSLSLPGMISFSRGRSGEAVCCRGGFSFSFAFREAIRSLADSRSARCLRFVVRETWTRLLRCLPIKLYIIFSHYPAVQVQKLLKNSNKKIYIFVQKELWAWQVG